MNPLNNFRDQIIIQPFSEDDEPQNLSGIYSHNRPFIKDFICDDKIFETEQVQVFKLKGLEEINLIMKRTVIDCPLNIENPLLENDPQIIKFFNNTLSEFFIAKIASTHCSSICPYFLYYTRLMKENKLVAEYFMEDGGLSIDRYVKSIHKSGNCQALLIDILFSSANILFYLESHKIAHNDIKMTNFVVNKYGQNLKLIDFGTAIWSPNDTKTEYHNKPIGFSRNYASPEVLNLENEEIPESQKRPINLWKSDIYSWGIWAILVLTQMEEISEEFKELRKNTPEKFTEILLENLPTMEFGIEEEMSLKLKTLLRFCLEINPSKRITFQTLRNILYSIDSLSFKDIIETSKNSLTSPSTTSSLIIQTVSNIDLFMKVPNYFRRKNESPLVISNEGRLTIPQTPDKNSSQKIKGSPHKINFYSPPLKLKASFNQSSTFINEIQECLKEMQKDSKFLFQTIKENEVHFKNFIIYGNRFSPSKEPKDIHNLEKADHSNTTENDQNLQRNPYYLEEENKKKNQENSEEINQKAPEYQVPFILDKNFISEIQNYYQQAILKSSNLCKLIHGLNQFLSWKKNYLNKDFLKSSYGYSIIKEVIDKINKIRKIEYNPPDIKDLKEIPEAFKVVIEQCKEISKRNCNLEFRLKRIVIPSEQDIKSIITQIEKYKPFSNIMINLNALNFPIYKSLVDHINIMIANIQNKFIKEFKNKKFTENLYEEKIDHINKKHNLAIEHQKFELEMNKKNYTDIESKKDQQKEYENLLIALDEQTMQNLILTETIEQIQRKHCLEIEDLKDQSKSNINKLFPNEKQNWQKYTEAKIREQNLLAEINKVLDIDPSCKKITSLDQIPPLILDLLKIPIQMNRIPEIKIDLQDSLKLSINSNRDAEKSNLNEFNKIGSNLGKFINQNDNQVIKNVSTNQNLTSFKNDNISKKDEEYLRILNPLNSHEYMKIISSNQERWDFSTVKFNKNDDLNTVLQLIGKSITINEVNLNISGEIQLSGQNINTLIEMIKGHKTLQSLTINCEKVSSKQIYEIGHAVETIPHSFKLEIINGSFDEKEFTEKFRNFRLNTVLKTNGVQKINCALITKK